MSLVSPRTVGLLALCVLAGASPLAAQPSTYAEVTFFGQQTVDEFQTAPPFILDLSHSDTIGSGRAVADLPHGLLKALTDSADVSPNRFTAIATGVDQFTLGGLPDGTPVSVTARLVADGTGLIPKPFESGQAMVQIQQGVGGIPVDFQTLSFQAGNNVPQGEVFPISLSASITFDATVGTPFPLAYFLRLDTQGAGTTFDFLSTARLGFDLPAGVSVTSVGGFNSAVPEPGALALLAVGLLSAAALVRPRR